ncbi:Thioredoxin-like fold [Pseudocohnilembus persalinus]|uniref:Thioredoxin-like fold n=1 Tax=Pseudocohnilembus persalinus TaxID=266149 RepID=A0A0V0R7J2_PSEPJ|nr:Thioredoxin-like fold [Pseudocohnilembus persalinus]|eukprot:KRX10461.1 Thioredoxin-like fold [Pseudocohnilembus persalinus]
MKLILSLSIIILVFLNIEKTIQEIQTSLKSIGQLELLDRIDLKEIRMNSISNPEKNNILVVFLYRNSDRNLQQRVQYFEYVSKKMRHLKQFEFLVMEGPESKTLIYNALSIDKSPCILIFDLKKTKMALYKGGILNEDDFGEFMNFLQNKYEDLFFRNILSKDTFKKMYYARVPKKYKNYDDNEETKKARKETIQDLKARNKKYVKDDL